MEPPSGRDSRFQLGYSMNLLSGESPPEIYGGGLGRPSTSLQQLSPRHTMVSSACGTRGTLKSDVCYDERGMNPQHGMGFESGGVNDIHDEPYSALQSKKSPPSNGKKTKGRVKIKMEYIENKLRRYTTFSKRKTGIMKKAYELSTLTGTQVMLLVASETGHVYTFATRKLQPMITSEAGKALIQTCLNSPDPPAGSAGGDQRMSATGFEETELTYNISDEDSKEYCGESLTEAEEDDDFDTDEEEEPPTKVQITSSRLPQPARKNSQETDSRTTEPKKIWNYPPDEMKKEESENIPKETVDESSIITQIKQINDSIIQSNKAKTKTTSSISVSPAVSIESRTTPLQPQSMTSSSVVLNSTMMSQLTSCSDPTKAMPLVVQTANGGMAFASVSVGTILGVTPEKKYVIMPLSAVIGSNRTIVIPPDKKER